MPSLAEAIRGSASETAHYRTPSGDTIIVHRVTGAPHISDAQESYAVSVQRAGQPPQSAFDAADLIATLDRLRDLHLPNFAPESPAWQPGA